MTKTVIEKTFNKYAKMINNSKVKFKLRKEYKVDYKKYDPKEDHRAY